MNLREAAQQALEAIDWLRLHLQRDHQCLHMDPAQSGIPAWINKSEKNLRAALAEPVQEPVAWRFQSAVGGWAYGSQPPLGSKYPVYPLYAAPPQRKPLTDEEIAELARQEQFLLVCDGLDELTEIARAIERAHGIGGHNESA